MNVVIINKEIFQNRPPVISTLLSLSDLGHNLVLITVDINGYWRKELERRDVIIYVIPDYKKRNKITKVLEYISFRNKTFSLLNNIYSNKQAFMLWVIGGNTINCLGNRIIQYRFILQIQELHEKDTRYLALFNSIINHAECVFMPEYNRTCIYQAWFKMSKRPIVLPNKPYFIDSIDKKMLIKYISSDLLLNLKSKKIILFQGQIVSYRDLSCFIKAAKEIGGYQIVLLGRHYNGMLEKYKSVDSSLIHIPHIPAPTYLAVTELAHICLLTYEPSQLNNIYCAPNKIYEYGAFSKPMVANDIPGLNVLKDYNAGVLVDDKDVEQIKNAYLAIENHYELYTNGALNLYRSIDNKEIIRKALVDIDEE